MTLQERSLLGLADVGLGKLSRDSFFAEMGNIDKAIARKLGIPEQMATTDGNVFNDAIDRARAAGKFRSADNSDKKKDYTSSLQRYIDQAAPSILRDMNRTDLIPLLTYEKPYFKEPQQQTTSPGGTNTNVQQPGSGTNADEDVQPDNTMKYALIGGGAILTVGIIAAIVISKRNKKKKKSE